MEDSKPGRKPEQLIFKLSDGSTFKKGTKTYMAAQAILRGETDSHKISTDIGTSLKNVQNVKSVMKRLLNEKVQEYS